MAGLLCYICRYRSVISVGTMIRLMLNRYPPEVLNYPIRANGMGSVNPVHVLLSSVLTGT